MPTIDLRFTVINQPVPKFIYEAIEPYVTASNHYFHQPEELREALAKRHSVTPDMVHLVAGIDQAVLALCAQYGQQTHIFTPTYVSYVDARRVGGELHEHWSLEGTNYQIATDTIEDASLIFLANPNNPAGVTPRAKILELVRNNLGATVVIDEAYGDFMPESESVVSEVAANPNLIVCRSFSKGFALAGFRIGYLIAQPSRLEAMELESTWFNTSYASAGAALCALQHEDHFAQMRAGLIETRKQTETYLAGAGYTCIGSGINAVLLEFEDEARATGFVEHLKAHDILVNQGNGASNVGLGKRHVRFSIGTEAEMEHVRQVIDGFAK